MRKIVPCVIDGKNVRGGWSKKADIGLKDIGITISHTLVAHYYKGAASDGDMVIIEISEVEEMADCKMLGMMEKDSYVQEIERRVYDSNSVSPTITTGGGRKMPKTLDVMAYDEQNDIVRKDVVGTIMCNGSSPKHNNRVVEISAEGQDKWIWEINGKKYRIRIRKLTPRECFRLMAFSDEDFNEAEKVNSNTQLYKQAGNSICECVLKEIIGRMV